MHTFVFCTSMLVLQDVEAGTISVKVLVGVCHIVHVREHSVMLYRTACSTIPDVVWTIVQYGREPRACRT